VVAPFPIVGRTDRSPLVLASSSPRRRELLGRIGLTFDVDHADVDETPRTGEPPVALVERLAAAKARAVVGRRPEATVIGADTVVDVDGEVFGKPIDADDARRMLRVLSGRTHLVHTCVAVLAEERLRSAGTTSAVTFVGLSPDVIEWYIGTAEPFDKAGAYALQGLGAVLVAAVEGSVTGVLGLPLDVTVELLAGDGRSAVETAPK
jgi:septum formation protein